MELKEAILQRKSIRGYEDTPVPDDKLNAVLEAARMAPSGGNRQPWKFVVVKDSEKRKELSAASGGQAQVAEAPVVIVAVTTMPESMMMCGVPGYPVDLAIAIDHMTLAAVDEGLGTCWIGAFSQEAARNICKIPDNLIVVALLTLGYPRDPGRPKDRKDIKEIVCYETYK